MKKPVITIEIVSDVVCPWCYIGKRRLEDAVSQLSSEFDFEISWIPFELNPDMPVGGTDQKEYLTSKFGGEERYKKLTDNVTRIAAEDGLVFNYDKQHNSPNTRNAHRVLWLAGIEGKQAAVKEALMKAYFTDGVDISKNENLIRVAAEAGLDHSKIETLLSSDDGKTEVMLAEKMSVERGVTGVPFYIINGKYAISGAQPAATFVSALREINASVETV